MIHDTPLPGIDNLTQQSFCLFARVAATLRSRTGGISFGLFGMAPARQISSRCFSHRETGDITTVCSPVEAAKAHVVIAAVVLRHEVHDRKDEQ